MASEIGAVLDGERVPAVPLEAAALVGGGGQGRSRLDGDPVVVEDPGQLAELLVSRDLGRLVRDPLHEVAVGADRPGAVVDDLVSGPVVAMGQPALRQRHPDGVGDTLSEGSGRGLHAGGVPVLGVARCPAAPLPKLADVVQREVIAGQVEEAVDEHGGVAGRENEAVAVDPAGVARIVPQVPGPEDVSDRCEGHGRAGWPELALLDRVHREDLDGVDCKLFDGGGCAAARGMSQPLFSVVFEPVVTEPGPPPWRRRS